MPRATKRDISSFQSNVENRLAQQTNLIASLSNKIEAQQAQIDDLKKAKETEPTLTATEE